MMVPPNVVWVYVCVVSERDEREPERVMHTKRGPTRHRYPPSLCLFISPIHHRSDSYSPSQESNVTSATVVD